MAELMYVYDGVMAPFKADTTIYNVYNTTNKVTLSEIKAMMLQDTDGTVCYRLEAPYFVETLCSTDLLKQRQLKQQCVLRNGFVMYFADKKEAVAYARNIRNQLIANKKSEIEQIQADITNLMHCKF